MALLLLYKQPALASLGYALCFCLLDGACSTYIGLLLACFACSVRSFLAQLVLSSAATAAASLESL